MGSVVLLVAACGGKVVVDAGGNGGSGGSGGDVASTGVVSPVGVVSVSTGGGTLCDQVCSKLAAKGCDTSQNCVADCQQSYSTAGECTSLLDTFAICVLNANSPGCDSPLECEDEAAAFESCVTVPVMCEDVACGGNGGSCACKGFCDNRVLAVKCTPGNATDFCTCFEDGIPVDECTMSQTGMNTCDLFQGCCAEVFFP